MQHKDRETDRLHRLSYLHTQNARGTDSDRELTVKESYVDSTEVSSFFYTVWLFSQIGSRKPIPATIHRSVHDTLYQSSRRPAEYKSLDTASYDKNVQSAHYHFLSPPSGATRTLTSLVSKTIVRPAYMYQKENVT